MSVQWMDDFKTYGSDSANLLEGTPWLAMVSSTLDVDPDPGASGRVLHVITDTHIAAARLALPSPDTKVGVAVRVWLVALPAFEIESKSVLFRSAANGNIYNWSIRPNGSVRLYRGTTLVADSVVPIVFAGSWIHFEFWIDTVSGEYWCFREGIEVSSLTGTDGSPPSTAVGIISFAHTEPGAGLTQPAFYIKSLIVADDSGTENSTPGDIGPVSLYTQPMVADVSGAWVPLTGTAMYAMTDNTDPTDAEYISADDTLPAAAVLEMEDLPSDIVAIRAVQMFGRLRKSDGGDAQVQMSLLSNGSEDTGADRAISTSFSFYHDISELDPDTGVAWTPEAFNAATFKLNRTV